MLEILKKHRRNTRRDHNAKEIDEESSMFSDHIVSSHTKINKSCSAFLFILIKSRCCQLQNQREKLYKTYDKGDLSRGGLPFLVDCLFLL